VQYYNLDEANKTRESIGRKPLTPSQANRVLQMMQGSAPVRDAAAFMQAVVNAPDPESEE
jgi:hypothetical protein